jgi:hypothetical protein
LPRRSVRVYGGALAVVVTVALLAALVGLRGQWAGQSASPSPSSADSLSPLAQAMRGINDDGTWSTETALAVFAAAFGPLPGVPEPPPDRSYHSGTAALQMVGARWSELTDAQKMAVRDYIGPAAPAIVLAAYSPLLDTYQQLADQAATDIASQLGHPLGIPIRIIYPPNENGTAWAWASGNWNEVPPGSHATACIVSIPPATVNDSSRAPYLRWLLLHEVWHCFESALVDLEAAHKMPLWISEGEANWVAEAVTGGAGQPPPMLSYWNLYVLDPGEALYGRAYDAVGFYSQLAQNAIDPWTVIEPIYKAGAGGSDAGFQASGANTPTFADRWGSSWYRDGQSTAAWAMNGGYGIPPVGDRATPAFILLPDGGSDQISAKPNSAAIADLNTTAFVTRIEVPAGTGRVGEATAGGLDRVVRLATLDLCTNPEGSCVCPSGTGLTGTRPEAAPPNLRLAVTGEQHTTSVMTLRGISKDEWCGKKATPRPSVPCGSGCGGSNGDPHLRTVNGARYDFQAAGEYVFLRAPDRSVEIQVRQEVPECVGPCHVTINTGVAASVNGHRVAFYTSSGVPDVRIDGVAIAPSGAGSADLGTGATLAAYRRGYELDFPDGTKLWALSLGSFGINVLVLPSDSLRASGAGLVAPVPNAGGFRVPALPDGSTLPVPKDRSDRHRLLYEVFGPAWRVTSTDTLFDYDAGKTTDSFTVASFPPETAPQSFEDVDPAALATARTACGSVADPDLADECAFDVATTGSSQYVSLYASTDQLQSGGTATLDQPPPPETPPPLDGLGSGIVLVADHIANGITAALGPDGTIYVEVGEQEEAFGDVKPVLLAVGPGSGTVKQRAEAVVAGGLAWAAGSLWAGEFKRGDGGCQVSRLDPVTLAVQANVPTICGGRGSTAFAAIDDAIWFVDPTGADSSGHGAHLRRIDPATNKVDASADGSVELPFVTDVLGAPGPIALTPSLAFSSTSTGLIFGDYQNGLYRFVPDSGIDPLGKPGTSRGWFPAGDGVWTQTIVGTSEEPEGMVGFFTGGSTPDTEIGITGDLVGADDFAVYAAYSVSDDEVDGLWRFPVDGGAPERLATSGFVPYGFGGQLRLAYRNLATPLLIGEHIAVKFWIVASSTENTQALALMIQAVPLP